MDAKVKLTTALPPYRRRYRFVDLGPEREWMVLLLGLCDESTERMITAVKEFLEKMWCSRRRV